ncbi:MAG: hypothetical protein C5B49_16620 [Bdellovibrio sp.]|nr:MAG: hypothetical protein C5B49_16620 [Bdellovibrio sp.]
MKSLAGSPGAKGYWLFLLPFLASTARAGKVDQVREAVKNSCQKRELKENEILEAVLKAFDCTPGTEVQVVVECKIKCLRENAGNVVGK